VQALQSGEHATLQILLGLEVHVDHSLHQDLSGAVPYWA
jgi:hypothetical protein